MLYHKLIEDHLDQTDWIVTDGSLHFTYLQLHQQAMCYREWLLSKGLVRGDRVVVVDVDPIYTLLLLLACIAEGFLFVPINPKADQWMRAEILRDCTPKIVIEDKMTPECSSCAEYKRRLCPDDTPAYLIYTSGTEGLPKGVVAQQNQIDFCCAAINQRLQNTKEDRILCTLPLSFDYGLYQIFLSLLSGAKLYFNSGNTLQRIPFLLREWRITALPIIPSAMNLLLHARLLGEKDVFFLRYISFTGETLPIALLHRLKELLPRTKLVGMYGMTECKRVSITPLDREDKVFSGSCGSPLDGVSVWLRNPDPSTGIGELVVEGPNVMSYWNVCDKASRKFAKNLLTGERQLFTGDFFRIDEEGFLYFCGRKNGLIKICGHRISSVWLENQAKMITGILEVCVLGCPDILTGEKAVFFVYLDRGTQLQALHQMIQDLPSFLHNSLIYDWCAPLPKSINGKIDRKFLEDFIRENV